jgi:hypothetical protein
MAMIATDKAMLDRCDIGFLRRLIMLDALDDPFEAKPFADRPTVEIKSPGAAGCQLISRPRRIDHNGDAARYADAGCEEGRWAKGVSASS